MIYLGFTIETINCHIKSHHNSFYGWQPFVIDPHMAWQPVPSAVPLKPPSGEDDPRGFVGDGRVYRCGAVAWWFIAGIWKCLVWRFWNGKKWSIGISTYDFKIWILKIFPDLIYEELLQYHEIWYWLKLDIVSPVTANLKSDPTSLLFETAHGCMVCVEHPYPPW